MAKNIFRDMLKPKTQLSRNGFDRSYLQNFTAKIGELLPVMCCETVPGSHYEINVSDMMRTIPMNQSAFIRASQHFEFYFVPYRQLWHRWDDFYTKRSMPITTEQSFDVPAAAPNASIYDIALNIASCAEPVYNEETGTSVLTTKQVGDIGEGIGEGALKIYNLLGYGSLRPYVDYEENRTNPPTNFENKKVNLFRAAAYQKIFFDYYRQPFYDLPFDGCQYAFNLDDADASTGAVNTVVSGKDDRAYYRLARTFQLHYRQWKKDLFTGVLPSTQFGAVSVVNTGASSGSVAIAAQTIAAGNLVALTNNQNVSGRGAGAVFNIDTSLDGSEFVSAPVEITGLVNHDDSTAILSAVNTDSDIVDFTLGNKPDGTIASKIIGDAAVTGTIPAHTGTFSSSGGFNVLQLVYAQAVQRWREITLRSGFRATEQYEGHFGVKPIFSEKDKCVFIDSVSSPLQVNTVTNTNAGATRTVGGSSVDIPLGDLGANGTSVLSGNKTIKFDAKDFGVLMCIYSMLPEATYQSQGVNPMNMKCLPDDFFVPEFENIGMQIVPMSLFKLPKSNTDDTDAANGYAARYFEYKVGIDVQSDEFRAAENYPHPTVGSPDVIIEAGRFYGWSPSREISQSWQFDGVTYPALFARDLYVSPRYFRDIFCNLPYKGNTSLSPYNAQFTIGSSKYDSFVHQCYFEIKCVQPMSVLGLPRY